MEPGLHGEADQARAEGVEAEVEEAEVWAQEVGVPAGWGVPIPEPAPVESVSARTAGQKRLIN